MGKRIVLTLTFLSLPFLLMACSGSSNVAGEWNGRMIQPEGPRGQDGYSLTLLLNQKDSVVTGTSRIDIPRTEYFALMKLEGTMKDDTLYFKEVAILDEKARTRWCLKEGALRLDKDARRLAGSWTAEGCTPGEIDVTKVR